MIVEATLDGKTLVGADFFGSGNVFEGYKYLNETSVARTNVSGLREQLEEYYEAEGKGDDTLISLPKGKGYRADFYYKKFYHAERLFRIAHNSLRVEYPGRHKFRFAILKAFINNNVDAGKPVYPPIYMQLAEELFWNAIERPVSCLRSTKDTLRQARIYIEKAIELKADDWFAYLVRGAIFTCLRNWEEAQRSFERAAVFGGKNAVKHPYYAAFFFARGRVEEGLQLMADIVEETYPDSSMRALHAVFLYAAGKLEEAALLAQELKTKGDHNWLAHLVWACVKSSRHYRLKRDDFVEGDFEGDMPDSPVSADDLFNSVGPFNGYASGLSAIQSLQESIRIFSNAERTDAHSELVNGHPLGAFFCPGVFLHMVGKLGYCTKELEEVQDMLLQLIGFEDQSAFQIAIAALGFSEGNDLGVMRDSGDKNIAAIPISDVDMFAPKDLVAVPAVVDDMPPISPFGWIPRPVASDEQISEKVPDELNYFWSEDGYFYRTPFEPSEASIGMVIGFLRKAADNHEPLAAWLHLWPMFDPIRHHPEFKKLLVDMGL